MLERWPESFRDSDFPRSRLIRDCVCGKDRRESGTKQERLIIDDADLLKLDHGDR